MIARAWHGRVPSDKADPYHEFLRRTGLADYRATPGNRGAWVFTRKDGDVTHFLLTTLWESVDAIKRFAGEDYERARYYAEDDEYLLEREPFVTHYEVAVSGAPAASDAQAPDASPTGQSIGGLDRAVSMLFSELIAGPAPDAAWVLNPGDAGLLQSLDTLTFDAASTVPPTGGASIAAHADHLRYGLERLNAWSRGDDAFAVAEYAASWRRLTVSEDDWAALRQRLRAEAQTWMETLRDPSLVTRLDLTAVLASAVHLAYHVGAIRQIDRSIRGPAAQD